MSTPFIRTYRPKILDEYLGSNIKDIVAKMNINENEYPKVILIHGTAGCGITTAARLLAKEYCCYYKGPSRVHWRACNECDTCLAVNKILNCTEYVESEGIMVLNGIECSIMVLEKATEWAEKNPHYPFKKRVILIDHANCLTSKAQDYIVYSLLPKLNNTGLIISAYKKEGLNEVLQNSCDLEMKVEKPDATDIAITLLKICEQEGIRTSMHALDTIAKQSPSIKSAIMVVDTLARDSNKCIKIQKVKNIL